MYARYAYRETGGIVSLSLSLSLSLSRITTRTHTHTHTYNQPLECLISFICSSNNNISRITLMLDRLRSNYGEELYKHETLGSIYSFPSTTRLAEITESELRDLGFGYRGTYSFFLSPFNQPTNTHTLMHTQLNS